MNDTALITRLSLTGEGRDAMATQALTLEAKLMLVAHTVAGSKTATPFFFYLLAMLAIAGMSDLFPAGAFSIWPKSE